MYEKSEHIFRSTIQNMAIVFLVLLKMKVARNKRKYDNYMHIVSFRRNLSRKVVLEFRSIPPKVTSLRLIKLKMHTFHSSFAFLLPGDHVTRIYLYLLKQALSACVAAVKCRPVFLP